MKQCKDKYILLPFAGLWITMLGLQAAACSALEIHMQYGVPLLFYGAVSLVIMILISLSGKWSYLGVGIVCGGIACWIWRFWERFAADMQILAYYINRRSEIYTGQMLFPQKWCQSGTAELSSVLMLGCVLLGIYIAITSLRFHSKLMTVIPAILIYCAALLLGEAPGRLPALLLVAGMSLLLMWISERQGGGSNVRFRNSTHNAGRGRRYVLTMLILALGLAGAWYLTAWTSDEVFQDVGQVQRRQHRIERDLLTKIEESGQYLRGMLGVDGGGTLSNAAPHYQKKTVMEVTVWELPKEPMYLRGFIGDVYHNGKWKASTGVHTVSAWQKRKSWKGKYSDSRYTSFTSEERDVSIHYTSFGRRSQYLYTPYSENSDDNQVSHQERSICVGDGDDELSLYQRLADNIIDTSDGVDDLLVMDIQEILRLNAKYSLDLEPVPVGRDYAENFLFYTQKGYCEHFATAGTLLLRNMNHYARYVTGYRVSPDDFEQNEDGTYTADVLDSSAHAWCEVWVDNSHWMPQEMTPSDQDIPSAGSVQSVDPDEWDEDERMTQYPQIAPTPDRTELPDPTDSAAAQTPTPVAAGSDDADAGGADGTKPGGQQTAGGGETGGMFPMWLRMVLIVSGAAAGGCLLAVILSHRKRKRIQRLVEMRSRNPAYYVRLRLEELLQRLRRYGMAVQVGMPEQQWIQMISEAFSGQLPLEDGERLLELSRRAAFSQEVVTADELDQLDHYCRKVEMLAKHTKRRRKLFIDHHRIGDIIKNAIQNKKK